eukprot:Gregarina_sp_Poly_1__8922@NODE_53_length_17536_cov_99_000057_g45_i0_p17_GENE_NODE_53_length_17536_cov_99_000057_g45_i0NODE_53_length_17536_cov_99_000057_g45_i0_p17_ORF_typecomplete_len105_score14_99Peptidase_M14/PF00246_24/3_5e15DUF2817/PF10994_8/0_056DUF2817/PF10994_8/32AstE_AspA/PF04952_14/0_019_NODE_53_length_17536_cov_99_000057_g45_i01240712721
MPVINPASRRLVDEGEFCIRANGNGVDLNRNWPPFSLADDNETSFLRDQYGGRRPLSEWETLTLKKILDDFQPDLFFTIHSGSLIMASPPAHKMQVAQNNKISK